MRALIAIAIACAACDAVPDVEYVSDDAPTGADGGNTCPAQVPPWATQCCGAIACSGAGCTAACADCNTQCTLAELCCPNSQGHAVCRSNLQCP